VVNQNRNDKPECLDAVGNLTDLFARMGARVPPVGRDLVDRNPANINHKLPPRTHGEHERADRVATDLQNLSGCFHPHFAGVTIPGHFHNRLSPAASFSVTRPLASVYLAPASRARALQAAFHKPTY